MYCKKCGGYVPDDGLFCTVCGERTDNYNACANPEFPTELKTTIRNVQIKEKRGNNGIIIAVIAGICVFAAILLIVALFTLSDSRKDEPEAALSATASSEYNTQAIQNSQVVTTVPQQNQEQTASSEVPYSVVEKFTGYWYEHRGIRCGIDISYGGDTFTVNIWWSAGGQSYSKWILDCSYNNSNGRLEYTDGVSMFIAENGSETIDYSDGSGSFYISDACLIWEDYKENTAESCYFLKKEDTTEQYQESGHVVDTYYGRNFVAYLQNPTGRTTVYTSCGEVAYDHWISGDEPVTIHEVYTDGCCLVSYITDAGSILTYYAKIWDFSF